MASSDTGTPAVAAAMASQKNEAKKPPSWEYQLREYLLLLSSVVVIATYAAGLAPPGGVRQKDDLSGGHKAGDPILQSSAGSAHPRYLAFYYCNATSFAASLVVNLLLLVLKETSTIGLAMLRTVMVLDVLALMGAYAAGSCRDLPSTIYVSTLVVALSAYLGMKIISQTRRNPPVPSPAVGNPDKDGDDNPPATSPAGGNPDKDDDVDNNELRKVLMLLATFATEITYTAGLSPPGGFQDDGDPTLESSGQSARLMAFFYCNTAAFVASLCIIVPLLSSRLQLIHVELYGPILIALFGLMGAYTAGSSRDLRTIAYVIALVAAVLAYILLVMVIALKKNYHHGGERDAETARDANLEQLDGEKVSKTNETLIKDNDFVLLLATLAASITYQAGLDPPGGVWSEDDKLHKAGDPILLSTHTKRYKAFFYCNSTAFAASLVVILMVQSKFVRGKALVIVTTILDLFGLIGAYAVGSSRDVSTSIYVSALAGAVLVYVVIHIVFWPDHFYMSDQKDKELELEKRRERLLLLAILVATIAYQAGLIPPGGFWNKDDGQFGHRAGSSVLLDNYPKRYNVFFYCNATSFMASVALIILLVNPKLYKVGIRCYALYVCMVVGMFGLMAAYAAGSARQVQTSIYVFVLVGVVIAFLFIQLVVYFNIRQGWKKLLMCLNRKKQEPGSKSDSANTATALSSVLELDTTCNTEEESKRKEYLMTLAILAASITYQAGLNPPGSVWQEGGGAGNPVMHDHDHNRYNAFFYCNSTSFVASIIVIILLLQHQQKKYGFLLFAMNTVIVVDLLGLLGAYAAGSCRDWETSGYVIGLAVVVLACIVIHFMLWYRNGMSQQKVGVNLMNIHP